MYVFYVYYVCILIFQSCKFSIQVKRLEILLQKCKDTIRNNKERNQQLTSEKDSQQQQIDLLQADITKSRVNKHYEKTL